MKIFFDGSLQFNIDDLNLVEFIEDLGCDFPFEGLILDPSFKKRES